MATLTVTIPNDKLEQFLLALADTYNYEPIIDSDKGPVPNPESLQEFAKRIAKTQLSKMYESYKAREADSARIQAIADAKAYMSDITVDY
jgi:hypothetical protein